MSLPFSVVSELCLGSIKEGTLLREVEIEVSGKLHKSRTLNEKAWPITQGSKGVCCKSVLAVRNEMREYQLQDTCEAQSSREGGRGSEGKRMEVGTLS